MNTPRNTNIWAGLLSVLFIATFLIALSCKSTGTSQRPASGNEYEITDREEKARQDSLILEKYAAKLEVDPQKVKSSFGLYQFIDGQMNTPCSERAGENTTTNLKLAEQLYKKVYNRKIPVSYSELYNSNLIAKFSSASYLAEGDLLFFEEKPDTASGEGIEKIQTVKKDKEPLEKVVGVYLQNQRFVTCAEEDGAVAINNLNQEYWETRYKVAGRLR